MTQIITYDLDRFCPARSGTGFQKVKYRADETERPFAIQIPYASGVDRFEILSHGKLLASISPQAELVASAIEKLPDNAFLSSPGEGRSSLLAVADEFRELMIARRYRAAAFLLSEKLTPMVNSIVSQEDTQSVFDVDREELFENINDALGKIEAIYSYEKAPSNGLIEAQLDKPGYLSNEVARLKVKARRLPENRELEYMISVSVNGAPVKVSSSREGQWSAISPVLMEGTSQLTVQLFIQNKRLANGFKASVRRYEARNLEIDQQLVEEGDQEIRESLLREKEVNVSVIADLNLKLASLRKPVGEVINLKLITL